METWRVALVVLAAVLVGAAIPGLVQLRATLRALEKTMERSGARFDEALGTTTAAARRLDAMVARVEEGGRIEHLVDGITAVSQTVSQLRDTLRVATAVGAAVGPAIGAAVRAFREDRGGAKPEEDSEAVTPERGKQAES